MFKEYEIYVNPAFSMQEARNLAKERYGKNFRGRRFDLEFLKQIANGLKKLNAESLIVDDEA